MFPRCRYSFCGKRIWPWQHAGFLTVWKRTGDITTTTTEAVWWHRDCFLKAGTYPEGVRDG